MHGLLNMGKACKVLNIIFRSVLIVAAGILLAYNVYMLIARTWQGKQMPTVFGYAFATVASGSMADTILKDDLIVTKAQDSYAVGDIITFFDGTSGTYITHRIILVYGSDYKTKGDASDSPDDFSVPQAAVVGKVVGVWRGAGKVITFFQSPFGLLCIIGGGAVLWLISDLVSEGLRKKDE